MWRIFADLKQYVNKSLTAFPRGNLPVPLPAMPSIAVVLQGGRSPATWSPAEVKAVLSAVADPSDLRCHMRLSRRPQGHLAQECPVDLGALPGWHMAAGTGYLRSDITGLIGQLQPQIVNWHSDMRKVHLFLPEHGAVT